MKPTDNIKKLIAQLKDATSNDLDKRTLNDVFAAMDNTKQHSAKTQNVWRIIMKSKISKLVVAAIILVAFGVSFILMEKTTTPAWAIQQTIDALGNIQTAVLFVKVNPEKPRILKAWVKREKNNHDSFLARTESGDRIGFLHNKVGYLYTQGDREIYPIYLEDSKDDILGLELWYELLDNAPRILPLARTIFHAAKFVANDWQEDYKTDVETNRDCVFVKGSYKPFSSSFEIVFDLETKLVVRAQYWDKPEFDGSPDLIIEKIVYNEEFPDELFDPGKLAKVISKGEWEKRYTLFQQANSLASKKQYRESIEFFLQLYEKYPQSVLTPLALQYIGECYSLLGEHEKAIEFFEKVLHEYSFPKKVIADVYRLLGSFYMSVEKNNEALDNFEKGLEFITQWDSEDWRCYRETYRKEVEENIEKLKKKNK